MEFEDQLPASQKIIEDTKNLLWVYVFILRHSLGIAGNIEEAAVDNWILHTKPGPLQHPQPLAGRAVPVHHEDPAPPPAHRPDPAVQHDPGDQVEGV